MMRIRDPGWKQFGSGMEKSRIQDAALHTRIPVPGSRDQKGTGSRIPDPDPTHWVLIGAFACLSSTVPGTIVYRYGTGT